MLPPYLTEAALDDLISRALREDVGEGDVTTLATIDPATRASAQLVSKANGTVAGLAVARRVFHAVSEEVDVQWEMHDGDPAETGEVIGRVEGPARALLTAERVALNLMQRMSGIATGTQQMVQIASSHGARILDTRKTVPGLRALDKWAVKLGGGHNHRIGLYDMILIKDNHIAACGGVRPAIRAARTYCSERDLDIEIEVEVRSLEELRAALEAGPVDWVLLDNMARRLDDGSIDVDSLRRAVQEVDGRCKTEASGNVTLETVAPIAATGVDAISCGALTHSTAALDISMRISLDA